MLKLRIHQVLHLQKYQGGNYVLPFNILGLHISGTLSYTINGEVFERPSPCVTLVPKGSRIELKCEQQRSSFAALLGPDGLRKRGDGRGLEVEVLDRWVRLPLLTRVPAHHFDNMVTAFSRLHSCFSSPMPRDRLRLGAALFDILEYLVEQEEQVFPSQSQPVERFKELLDADTRLEERLEDLAARCGRSLIYLRNRFQERYGTSPGVYRRDQRMARAHLMLRSGFRSIEDVAKHVGFAHPQHFTSAFKLAFGLLPKEVLRMENLNQNI